MSSAALPRERRFTPTGPLDLAATLGSLGRGAADPVHRRGPDGGLWRVSRTPDGAATLRLHRDSDGTVLGAAWGPGADWVLDGLPELLGEHHPCDLDVAEHPLLARLARRFVGVRIPRTRLVWESLVLAVLEQKVTGTEARVSFGQLVRRFGEAPPGPAPEGMALVPDPARLRLIPSWEWHRAGVGPERARTLVRAAGVVGRLREAVTLTGLGEGLATTAARARLQAVPGIGVWTSAEVAQRAFGDCDAVSYGDYHVAAHVGWCLTGAPVDDDAMMALLAPWAPHRGRVVRLLEAGGPAKPRFGPRATIRDFRGV